jgi:Zn-dependent peptidase ImmA (M78 family)
MEQEANDFASALLLPAKDVNSDLTGRLDLARLSRLKQKWGVSMQAIMMRAASLGAITPNQKTNLSKLMSKKGYRKAEPTAFDIPYETPSTLSKLINCHLNELGYSVDELAQALHINVEDLENRYGVSKTSEPSNKPKLKLVQ